MDRSWMYDRMYPGRAGLKRRFVQGVEEFVLFAKCQKEFEREGGIRCPCSKCRFRSIKNEGEVRLDLYNNGFLANYWIWTRHGEVAAGVPAVDNVSVQNLVGPTASPVVELAATSSPNPTTMGSQSFDVVQGMISDAVGVNLNFEEPQYDAEEVPNEEAQRFYMFLSETNKPLFEGSKDSKLSMCVRLLGLKSQFNVAEMCMEYMTKMMLDATPIRGLLPQSYYDAKRLVSKLGLNSMRIDCCVSGCMIYYNNEFGINDGDLLECKFCQEPRYYVSRKGTSKGKQVPRKAMFYLPIISRLKECLLQWKQREK